ncbi:DUF11 domain-containing protein [Methanosalsum natronophilum]|uniref:DUF11 domain-containing protein n=1 Tax=Methanosalsum natronophilum TaxID=768733 RepID=UPI002166DD13|nr:DUF11 domain-containing protein [Methanosalsum natronophilum]MCS3923571.1 hypothetical protein [Methanosalsum natronophilum]
MIEKRTILLLVAMMAAIALILPATAAADASIDRSMPASVGPGDEFTVTITASNYGAFAQVTETLPAGFSYVSSSLDSAQVSVDGNDLTFTVIGQGSFTYTVEASETAGDYQFSGILKDMNLNEVAVTGATSINVSDTPVDNGNGNGNDTPVDDEASATRSMPASVGPGDEFTVTITASNYGSFAQVTETLPAGFSYVSSSLDSAQVSVDGNDLTFTVIGQGSFTYTVEASETAGDYQFSGVLKDMNLNEVAVAGATSINVSDIPVDDEASAIRSMPASVGPGDEFTVTITASNYGAFAQVTETLPAGFSYVSSSLDSAQVSVDGNDLTFTVIGQGSFTYTVEASETAGDYQFSGVLKDMNLNEVAVAGNNAIYISAPIEGMELMEGWNFISIPHELENSSIHNVFKDVEDHVVLYYNASEAYQGSQMPWELAEKVEPLKGYWVYSGTEQTVDEEYLKPLVPAAPGSLKLYPGYNAIGYTSMDTLPADIALKSIDKSYHLIKGPFNPAIPGMYEQIGHQGESGSISGVHVGTDVFEMNPYIGYWIDVTEETTLSSL